MSIIINGNLNDFGIKISFNRNIFSSYLHNRLSGFFLFKQCVLGFAWQKNIHFFLKIRGYFGTCNLVNTY